MPDLKKGPYTNMNPNGRVPALVDPNNGMTQWEQHFQFKRVISDIDGHLEKNDTDFLVGNKATYVDLMFIPYSKSMSNSGPVVKGLGHHAVGQLYCLVEQAPRPPCCPDGREGL
ncbi:hypothetical protein F5Y19DRAFT_478142 [Xylariaceae sp. FL1651]|nr:hypothetical protein F5Y19DRAFT_478142 [Xylariaceae sp. FL1651]